MKLHLLDRSSLGNESLKISHNQYRSFLKIWHFHEELELVHIIQSTGLRLIGDHIGKFDVGDLVLIGKNLPHMWMNDSEYFDENSTLTAEAIAVHFKREFLGPSFFEIPEMSRVAHMLDLATQGIKFENVDPTIITAVKSLVDLDSSSRVVQLISILDQLSKVKSYKRLSSRGFVIDYLKSENRRLDKMYEYVFENFNTPIGSSDVAKVMCMNSSAFSRFFKKIHRKSFTKYLNEIRIGYACKLLIGGENSITSICYLCGFNNVSNFNRQFKLIKGESPSAYLQSHII